MRPPTVIEAGLLLVAVVVSLTSCELHDAPGHVAEDFWTLVRLAATAAALAMACTRLSVEHEHSERRHGFLDDDNTEIAEDKPADAQPA